jgi:ankyrin repeat protein
VCCELWTQDILARDENAIQARDISGEPLLGLACKLGFFEMARFLLSNGGNVSNESPAGFLPIHHAAAIGNVDIIR